MQEMRDRSRGPERDLVFKLGKRLVLRGRRRVPKGRLAEVAAHLACIARDCGEEAVAQGFWGELAVANVLLMCC